MILCEVKTDICRLNPSWTDSKKQNLQLILKAVGTHIDGRINKIAKCLYNDGVYKDKKYQIRLLCLGKQNNPEISQRFPRINQILFDEILGFIYERFSNYRNQKVSHPQWDDNGKHLWETFEEFNSTQEFQANIKILNNNQISNL